jgi:cbb3-type cytochrome oxidase cytochrome c subunit
MENPRSTSPNSIMPPYDWLLRREAELDDLPTKLRVLKSLGTPYTQEEVDNAVSLAEAQAQAIAEEVVAQGGPDGLADKEITALVAFLQRLGTDLVAPGVDLPPAEDELEGHEVDEIQQTLDASTP